MLSPKPSSRPYPMSPPLDRRRILLAMYRLCSLHRVTVSPPPYSKGMDSSWSCTRAGARCHFGTEPKCIYFSVLLLRCVVLLEITRQGFESLRDPVPT